MGITTITESGMTFGPFPDSGVFSIEKSTLYRSNFLSHGIKTCEFVLLRNKTIYFIEAKTSCPNHNTAMENDEKRVKLDEFVKDVSQKMRDSLNLFTSILLKLNHSNELPKDMENLNLSNIQIRFVLVVKNAQNDWLIHYPDVFQNELRNEMKIWRIPTFAVITETKAREKNFLVPPTDNGT